MKIVCSRQLCAERTDRHRDSLSSCRSQKDIKFKLKIKLRIKNDFLNDLKLNLKLKELNFELRHSTVKVNNLIDKSKF